MRSRTWRRRPLRRAPATGAASDRRDRARAAAGRLLRLRAPGRAGRRADLCVPRRRAWTRADTRPRRTRGTCGCRAGASRASGTSYGGGSRLDDDEPLVLEEQLAADLGRERLRLEVALVHLPPGAVAQHTLFPARGLDALLAHRGDDHELRCHAPRLGEESQPLLLLEVAVEVAREDAFEGAVFERQRQRVALDEAGVRNARAGDHEHPLAVVEPDHLAWEVPGQEARAAGHVERPSRWKVLDHAHQGLQVLLPARPHGCRCQAGPEPPVVVLGRPAVVVLLHRLLEYAR